MMSKGTSAQCAAGTPPCALNFAIEKHEMKALHGVLAGAAASGKSSSHLTHVQEIGVQRQGVASQQQ
jgi:hypothetical protein